MLRLRLRLCLPELPAAVVMAAVTALVTAVVTATVAATVAVGPSVLGVAVLPVVSAGRAVDVKVKDPPPEMVTVLSKLLAHPSEV